MGARTLPFLCILFLLCSASLVVLPSTEAARILDETKAGNRSHYLSDLCLNYICMVDGSSLETSNDFAIKLYLISSYKNYMVINYVKILLTS
jgi:hypothetical protein